MAYNKDTPTHSVYLHWPFCPYRCHFCPFVALAGHDQFMEQYCAALKKEIDNFSHGLPVRRLDTLFLGGGTPSTWPDQLLLDTFDILRDVFCFTQEKASEDGQFGGPTEVTIEVNPGTVRPEQFQVWRAAGINRLSIGVQSLNTKVLHSLNRLQSSEQVFQLLEQAQHEFENISVDLILGLPGITDAEWKQLIQTAVGWPIKHISVYFLTIHENTPLYFNIKRKKVMLPHEDGMVDLYHWTVDTLAEHGFEQYELSNFAKPGFACRHNQAYWNRVPYKGFGLGACSFDGTTRLQNEKNLMRYMEGVAGGNDVTNFQEVPDCSQIHLEKVMLGLRRRPGVTLDWLMADLDEDEQTQFSKQVEWLKENSFIEQEGDILRLTPQGLVVENEIIAKLTA